MVMMGEFPRSLALALIERLPMLAASSLSGLGSPTDF